ncbi:MAG: hypothetical protein MJ183_06700, partial [Treponemataceae bacterium]|nr:hypothetical protein [Treponemataceae bacterium]
CKAILSVFSIIYRRFSCFSRSIGKTMVQSFLLEQSFARNSQLNQMAPFQSFDSNLPHKRKENEQTQKSL